MGRRSYRFAEEYDGLLGFGMDRRMDEATVACYLQMFSDDTLLRHLCRRMSNEDLESLFNHLGDLLRKYLSEEEYHRFFLMDEPADAPGPD